MRYTLRLSDESIGYYINDDDDCTPLIGDIKKIFLWDENGLPLEREGTVAEILEESQ